MAPNVKNPKIWICMVLVLLVFVPAQVLCAESSHPPSNRKPPSDGTPVKRVLGEGDAGENLLRADAWKPWHEGFERLGDVYMCDNGSD